MPSPLSLAWAVAAITMIAAVNSVDADCYTDSNSAYNKAKTSFVACMQSQYPSLCDCRTEFNSYHQAALQCGAPLPAGKLQALVSHVSFLQTQCDGQAAASQCNMDTFAARSAALQSCISSNSATTPSPVCGCVAEFDSYEEIGALCLSDITTSAKNTLESTISTFDTHCAAGSGQCKSEDCNPHAASFDDTACTPHKPGTMATYNSLWTTYESCIAGQPDDYCTCRSDFDHALAAGLLCEDSLSASQLTTLQTVTNFYRLVCSDPSDTLLSFSPMDYTADTNDVAVRVYFTRKGHADVPVSGVVSVHRNGVFSGQQHAVQWAAGDKNPASVLVDIKELHPTNRESFVNVSISLGSIVGAGAVLNPLAGRANIIINHAGAVSRAIAVAVPGTGIVWAADNQPKYIQYDTSGFVGDAYNTALTPQLVALNGDGSTNATFTLGGTVTAETDWAEVTLNSGSAGTPSVLDWNPVPPELTFKLRLTTASGAAASAESAAFAITTGHAEPRVANVAWNSTTGTSKVVVGQRVSVTWTLTSAAPGGVVDVAMTFDMRDSVPGTRPFVMKSMSVEVGNELSGRVDMIAPDMSAVPDAIAIWDLYDTKNRGHAGFGFTVTLVGTSIVSAAKSSSSFSLRPALSITPSGWTVCSETCGFGDKTRTQHCYNNAQEMQSTGYGLVPLAACPWDIRPGASYNTCVNKPCDGGYIVRSRGYNKCSAPCGGGVQSRILQCVHPDGSTSSDISPCTSAGVELTVTREFGYMRPCINTQCEAFSWVAQPWQPCSDSCAGSQLRHLACTGASGSVSTWGDACANEAGVPSARQSCGASTCPAARWKVGAWGKCSVACDSGTTTRTVTCVDAAGSTLAEDSCPAADKPAASRACNTQVCRTALAAWKADQWGECSKSCGGGTKTRDVACVDADGDPASGCPAASKPATTTACNTADCDPCERLNNFCGAPGGSCAAGVCVCNEGYWGPFCRAKEGECDGGVFDHDGKCCASGVLSAGAQCCSGSSSTTTPAVDRDGKCCASGQLDECDVCDGSGLLALDGSCCATGALNAAGYCCESGVVDVCGVCDGTGHSCAVQAQLSVGVSDSDASSLSSQGSLKWRRYEDTTGATSVATALGVNADNVALTMTSVTAAAGSTDTGAVKVTVSPTGSLSAVEVVEKLYDEAASGSSYVTQVVSFTFVGVCGNGVCESGERCSVGDMWNPPTACCFTDCPLDARLCDISNVTKQQCGAAGRGACDRQSGTCKCYSGRGYTGPACNECLPEYAMVAGTCRPLPQPLPPVKPDGPTKASITVIIIVAVLAVLAIGVAMWYWKPWRTTQSQGMKGEAPNTVFQPVTEMAELQTNPMPNSAGAKSGNA